MGELVHARVTGAAHVVVDGWKRKKISDRALRLRCESRLTIDTIARAELRPVGQPKA